MGHISRNGTAPYVDGEELDGRDDLEVDFNSLYSEFNGNIDNANFATLADIDAEKFADSSIEGGKFEGMSITPAKMAAAAVYRHHVSVATSQTWTSNSGHTDFSGITAATFTNVAETDTFIASITISLEEGGTTTGSKARLGWGIRADDGTLSYNCPTNVIQHEIEEISSGPRQHSLFGPAGTRAVLGNHSGTLTITPYHTFTNVSGSPLATVPTILSITFMAAILPGYVSTE